MDIEYAFSETATASPDSPWHVRHLVSGLKTSGGADSLALCGREVAWDIKHVEVSDLIWSRHARESGQVRRGLTCVACDEKLVELGI